MLDYSSVLIVGAGEGFSASLARAFAREGVRVTLAARRPERLGLAARRVPRPTRCDASDPAEVAALFAALDEDGAPDAVVYNPSLRARGPLVELDPRRSAVRSWSPPSAPSWWPRRPCGGPTARVPSSSPARSAGVKGYPRSAPSPWAVRASRPLQSMARELHPQGIRVVHLVIDGATSATPAVPSRATGRTACSTPTPSPRPRSTSCASRAAPGPGRSSCAPGWRPSEWQAWPSPA